MNDSGRERSAVVLRRLVLLIAVICALPSLAAADGAFAKGPSAAYRKLAEPNQKAFLMMDGGTETLILQVKYEGEVEDFGWIVPVPSRPKTKPGTGRLFFELALLTTPLQASSGKGGKGGMGGSGAGVYVVEHALVGPYDATVLAATDPNALAGWLRQHDYMLPGGAEDVLKSYVDRDWYYVALRIRVKRDLLPKLRRIDPGVRSLDQAPERLAGHIIALTETRPEACAKKLQAIDQAYRWATADPSDPQGTEGGGELSRAYRQYRTWQQDLEQGRVSDREVQGFLGCLPRCAGGLDAPAFRAAAKRAGWPSDGSAEGLARAFYVSVQQDLLRGVPYAQSHVGRFHNALRAAKQGEKHMFWYFQLAYQTTRRMLPEIRQMRGPAEQVDRLEAGLHEPRYTADPIRPVVRMLDEKLALYRQVARTVTLASSEVKRVLAGGTITPLRLEFASDELVYPLRLSSLNPGATDIDLYVLSDHRARAAGFRTDFAGDVASPTPEARYRELSKLLAPGRTYLTELRAIMEPADMTRDVTIKRAATDEPVWATAVPDTGLPVTGRGRRPAYQGRRRPYR
jgi:hypothetical protein